MDNEGYKITKWKGLDNYECLYSPCKFATLNLKEINQHVGRHISDKAQLDPLPNQPDPGDQAPDKKPKKGRGKKVK